MLSLRLSALFVWGIMLPRAAPPQPLSPTYESAFAQVRALEDGRVARFYEAGGKAPALKLVTDLQAGDAAPFDDLQLRLYRLAAEIAQLDGAQTATDRTTLEAAAQLDVASSAIKKKLRDRNRGPWQQTRESIDRQKAILYALQLTLLLAGALLVLGVGTLLRSASALPFDRYDLSLVGPSWTGDAPDAALAGLLLTQLRQLAEAPTLRRGLGREHELGELLSPGSTSLRRQLTDVANLIDSSAAVTLGIVKIPMQGLFKWIVEFAFPAKYRLVGTIGRSGNETTFVLHRRRRLRRSDVDQWTESVIDADAAAAQAEVIRRIAFRLIVKLTGANLGTREPVAFAAYHRALEHLDDVYDLQKSASALKDARAALCLALRADPTFWQAKLKLGVVYRKLGRLDLAHELFVELSESAQLEGIDRLELRTQEIVLASRSRRYPELWHAARQLEHLVPHLSSENGQRYYGLSILASLYGKSLAPSIINPIKTRQRRGTRLAQIAASFEDRPDELPRTYGVAEAFARYAFGRHLIDDGQLSQAKRQLLRALAAFPDLVVAHVALARAYRVSREPIDWFDRARRCLNTALEISPDDASVHLELAKLHFGQSPPQADEGMAQLKVAAKNLASARFLLGQKAVATQPLEGARLMWEAIDMAGIDTPVGYAKTLIEETVKAQVGSSVADQAQLIDYLRRARSWLRDYDKDLERLCAIGQRTVTKQDLKERRRQIATIESDVLAILTKYLPAELTWS